MWLVSFEINGRLQKACPPDHTNTYIRSKYSTWANTTTDLEIYKRVWTHSWAIGPHLSAPRRLIFLRPSLCWVLTGPHFYFINVTADEAFASGIIASVSSSVFLLSPPGATAEKVYWKPWRRSSRPPRDSSSHLETKSPQVQYHTFKLLWFFPLWRKQNTAGLTYPGTLPENS